MVILQKKCYNIFDMPRKVNSKKPNLRNYPQGKSVIDKNILAHLGQEHQRSWVGRQLIPEQSLPFWHKLESLLGDSMGQIRWNVAVVHASNGLAKDRPEVLRRRALESSLGSLVLPGSLHVVGGNIKFAHVKRGKRTVFLVEPLEVYGDVDQLIYLQAEKKQIASVVAGANMQVSTPMIRLGDTSKREYFEPIAAGITPEEISFTLGPLIVK